MLALAGGARDRDKDLSYSQKPHYLTLFVTSHRLVWFHCLTRL
jgi:hypothetical protein